MATTWFGDKEVSFQRISLLSSLLILQNKKKIWKSKNYYREVQQQHLEAWRYLLDVF
jgi:hypothetical protein